MLAGLAIRAKKRLAVGAVSAGQTVRIIQLRIIPAQLCFPQCRQPGAHPYIYNPLCVDITEYQCRVNLLLEQFIEANNGLSIQSNIEARPMYQARLYFYYSRWNLA
mgnify:CR=1 FL=1